MGNDSGSDNDLSLGLPAGVGATVAGKTTRLSGQVADDLVARIQEKASDTNDRPMSNEGQRFLDQLPDDGPVTARTITPSFTGDGVPGTIDLSGSDASDGFEAVVLDVSNLPSGTVINLSNIDFVWIVGGTRIVGGAGDQIASGDSSGQIIVLGPGDDVLRVSGGDDEVRSEGGDDLVRGGDGDDRLFGNRGNDTLVGGTGDDRVELTGFTGRLTWVDPTPGDMLVLTDLELMPAQVRVDSAGLSANEPAVLRLDVNTDGTFADDEPAIVLDRLARAEVQVATAESGGTAIQLTGADLPLADLAAEDQLASLYVAYFGRAADPQGLAFWEDRFADALADGASPIQALTGIAEDFRFSAEAFERFPVLNPSSETDSQAVQGFVESVYDSLFNRPPEAAGLDFWIGPFQARIQDGQDIGMLLITIIAAAGDADAEGEENDATTVRNKIEAAGAGALTDALTEAGLVLGEDISLAEAHGLITDKRDNYASFETALEEIQTLTTTGDDGMMG